MISPTNPSSSAAEAICLKYPTETGRAPRAVPRKRPSPWVGRNQKMFMAGPSAAVVRGVDHTGVDRGVDRGVAPAVRGGFDVGRSVESRAIVVGRVGGCVGCRVTLLARVGLTGRRVTGRAIMGLPVRAAAVGWKRKRVVVPGAREERDRTAREESPEHERKPVEPHERIS